MNKMLRVDFGFGVGLQADGSPVTPEQEQLGLAHIRDSALTMFGGCTLTRTVGDWKDESSGKVYSERGFTLSILTDGGAIPLEAQVLQLAEDIKRWLNQKAIYVVRYAVQSTLY